MARNYLFARQNSGESLRKISRFNPLLEKNTWLSSKLFRFHIFPFNLQFLFLSFDLFFSLAQAEYFFKSFEQIICCIFYNIPHFCSILPLKFINFYMLYFLQQRRHFSLQNLNKSFNNKHFVSVIRASLDTQ